MATKDVSPGDGGILDGNGLFDGQGLSRRKVLARSAALGGTLIAGSTLTGRTATALAKPPPPTSKPSTWLPPPPPPAPKELQVEMVPLSHDDLDWNGQSKWRANGFTWAPDPMWFWWGYITGMSGQQN